MDYPHPCDVNAASSLLFDMVVLAGGEASHMSPLCDAKPKPLLPLCNRPLIWYTLKPWVDSGVSTFHVVTHADQVEHLRSYLTNSTLTEFPSTVNFEFIEVAQNLEEDDTIPTDSADGLRAFAEWKKNKGRKGSNVYNLGSTTKDVLVTSCDTILANVDMQPFIHNFYRTFSSASTLMVSAPPKEQQKAAFYSSDDACLIAIEAAQDSTATANAAGGRGVISHDRLHMHYVEGAESLDLSVGFVARRPNLKFSKTALDVHVYLLKGWILDFLLLNGGINGIRSVRDDLFAILSTSQYWKVNGEEAMDPGTNLKFKIPPHWMVAGSHHYHAANLLSGGAALGAAAPSAGGGSGAAPKQALGATGSSTSKHRGVSMLNSMQDHLPRPWDDLRVFATTYTHDALHRIVRINSKERYKAVSEDIVVGLLGPVSAVTSPLQAMVIRQLERETALATQGAKTKARGTALLSMPPEDARIGRSVIGRGVKLGKKCKIQRSVIMDNAEIGDGTVVSDCVICANIQIGAGETLEAKPTAVGGIAVEVVAVSTGEDDDENDRKSSGGGSEGGGSGGDDEFSW